MWKKVANEYQLARCKDEKEADIVPKTLLLLMKGYRGVLVLDHVLAISRG